MLVLVMINEEMELVDTLTTGFYMNWFI